jgi:KUP system potassium uptake protein
MTLQASRLGYLPRVRVLHTSDQEQGQIYIPSVNWLMLLAVIALVLAFKSSGHWRRPMALPCRAPC